MLEFVHLHVAASMFGHLTSPVGHRCAFEHGDLLRPRRDLTSVVQPRMRQGTKTSRKCSTPFLIISGGQHRHLRGSSRAEGRPGPTSLGRLVTQPCGSSSKIQIFHLELNSQPLFPSQQQAGSCCQEQRRVTTLCVGGQNECSRSVSQHLLTQNINNTRIHSLCTKHVARRYACAPQAWQAPYCHVE